MGFTARHTTVPPRKVFITGGTGYMGRRLIAELLQRGHEVRALVRAGSEQKLPPGCPFVTGNALDASYGKHVSPADTFVQLVGVSHPSPSKARQFREIDLVAGRAAVEAAKQAHIRHFIYVSVAQPTSVMKAYVEVRAEVEGLIRASGLDATIIRPWYVLGPGHRWPYLLKPVYWILERIPRTRDSALRLGLVTLEQMVRTLADAVGHPCRGIQVVSVPEIRQAAVEG